MFYKVSKHFVFINWEPFKEWVARNFIKAGWKQGYFVYLLNLFNSFMKFVNCSKSHENWISFHMQKDYLFSVLQFPISLKSMFREIILSTRRCITCKIIKSFSERSPEIQFKEATKSFSVIETYIPN